MSASALKLPAWTLSLSGKSSKHGKLPHIYQDWRVYTQSSYHRVANILFHPMASCLWAHTHWSSFFSHWTRRLSAANSMVFALVTDSWSLWSTTLDILFYALASVRCTELLHTFIIQHGKNQTDKWIINNSIRARFFVLEWFVCFFYGGFFGKIVKSCNAANIFPVLLLCE